MNEKEMIEEMAKDLKNCLPSSWYWLKNVDSDTYLVAKHLHEQGYRKIPEGSVVLSKEEYEELQKGVKTHNYTAMFNAGQEARITELEERLYNIAYKTRKETAKEILEWLKQHTFDSHFGIIDVYFKETFGVEVRK